jgi:hypothetical protein
MTPKAVLEWLRHAGVSVAAEGGKLRLRAPKGALTPDLRNGASAVRDGLLALITAPGLSGGEADASLARIEVDLATARRRHAGHAARLAVLDAVEAAFRRHHERGDLLLIEDEPLVAEMLERWAREDAAAARRAAQATPWAV